MAFHIIRKAALRMALCRGMLLTSKLYKQLLIMGITPHDMLAVFDRAMVEASEQAAYDKQHDEQRKQSYIPIALSPVAPAAKPKAAARLASDAYPKEEGAAEGAPLAEGSSFTAGGSLGGSSFLSKGGASFTRKAKVCVSCSSAVVLRFCRVALPPCHAHGLTRAHQPCAVAAPCRHRPMSATRWLPLDGRHSMSYPLGAPPCAGQGGSAEANLSREGGLEDGHPGGEPPSTQRALERVPEQADAQVGRCGGGGQGRGGGCEGGGGDA